MTCVLINAIYYQFTKGQNEPILSSMEFKYKQVYYLKQVMNKFIIF